jgi:hypothetical protein
MYTVEQKKAIILAAINSKLVTGMDINSNRKGADVSKLKNGKEVAGVTIERLWSNLSTKLGAGKIEALANSPLDNKLVNKLEIKLGNQLEKDEITTLKEQVAFLMKEVASLKNEVAELKSQHKQKPIDNVKSILGWTLQQKKGFWYAAKNIDGKVRWIYIGKDVSQAVVKIKAWLGDEC